MVFGRKAERFEDPSQQALFTDGEQEAAPASPAVEIVVPAHTRKKRGGGRMKISDDLPCVDIVHELPERDLVDPVTGEALYEAFGFRVTKKLACEPMRLYAERHLHVKYRLIQSDGVPAERLADGDRPEALTAPATQEGLEDCLAAPSLLAELTYAKYVMHTPFDRQLKDIKRRSGVEISSTTVSRWAIQLGLLCHALVDLMKRRLIEHSAVIQHDDTPVRQQPVKNSKRQEVPHCPVLECRRSAWQPRRLRRVRLHRKPQRPKHRRLVRRRRDPCPQVHSVRRLRRIRPNVRRRQRPATHRLLGARQT